VSSVHLVNKTSDCVIFEPPGVLPERLSRLDSETRATGPREEPGAVGSVNKTVLTSREQVESEARLPAHRLRIYSWKPAGCEYYE